MSQLELRKDQMTLYPMQHELNTEEQLRLKGGTVLWLVAMSVPILLLAEVRYVIANGYVDPNANPLFGGIGLLLLIVSAILTTAAKSGRDLRRKALALYAWAFWCTLAAFVLIGWHVVDQSESTLTHYGMTFMTALGTADFYVFGMLVALLATRGRVKRVQFRNTWGLTATSYYAWYIVAVWLVVYLVMYFL